VETEQSVLTRSWSLLRRAVRRGGAAENRSDFETAPTILRLAIVSTPRSGNTWLRHMLSSTFAMHELDRHRPSDVPWGDLPERCVLQIHWLREAPFASLLERHSFRVVTLARHPLDMLISLLHWVVRCPHPESVWTDNPALGGDRGTEVLLLGASPTSEAFLAWACSPRAVALLSVSLQWWDAPGCIGVRYEDLVRSAPDELQRIAGQLGVEPSRDPAEVAAAHTMDRLRDMQREPSQHYWQGQPGLWRRLLPAAEARRIAAAHAPSFARFGYVFDPDETLSRADAATAWRRLVDG
jgi:hypothetical protein